MGGLLCFSSFAWVPGLHRQWIFWLFPHHKLIQKLQHSELYLLTLTYRQSYWWDLQSTVKRLSSWSKVGRFMKYKEMLKEGLSPLPFVKFPLSLQELAGSLLGYFSRFLYHPSLYMMERPMGRASSWGYLSPAVTGGRKGGKTLWTVWYLKLSLPELN